MKRRRWICDVARVALAVSVGSIATNALAQEASVNEDEIIVTARKRVETINEVPAAITAITAEDRENLVLDGMRDYLRQVPGATLVSSGPEYLQDITIRGQGSGRLGFSESATGLFRDGLYNAGGGFGGRSLTRLDFFDAERIEVLRGPQGALYGRNSVGGAVDVKTQKPLNEFGGNLLIRYSEPDRKAVEGTLNAPIVRDKLALRIGGFIDKQNSGHIQNMTLGTRPDRQRFSGLRAALRWTPSTATTVDASYERYDSTTPAFGNLARRPLRVDGTPLDPSPFVRVDLDREGFARVNEDAFYFAFEHDFGGVAFNLRASRKNREGGRTGEDSDHFAGQSGIDVDPSLQVRFADYTVAQIEQYERTVAQAYLSSTGESAVNWLIGAEYLQSEGAVQTDPQLCPAYTGALLPITPGCFVGLSGTLTGSGATVRNAARLGLNNDSFNEKINSPSAFASVEFGLGGFTRLGLEARIQRDGKSFLFERFSEDPLVFFGAGAVPTGLIAGINTDPDGPGPLTASPVQFCPPTLAAGLCAAGRELAVASISNRKTYFTPTVTLRQDLGAGSNIYARLSTGYRPGGFNTNLPPTTVRSQFQNQLAYGSEYAYSGEIGAKGRFAGVQMSTALFYVKTDDIQVVSAPSALSRGFVLQNAGGAHVYGYELELRKLWRFSGGASFQLKGSLSGQKGEFEKGAEALIDINGDGIPDAASLAGNEVPRLRDYQIALNATLTFPVMANVDAFVSGGLQSAHGGFETPDNSRNYSGYDLIDARVGFRTDMFTFSVFARNLTNEFYITNLLNTNEFYSEPRVVGAELRMKF